MLPFCVSPIVQYGCSHLTSWISYVEEWQLEILKLVAKDILMDGSILEQKNIRNYLLSKERYEKEVSVKESRGRP